MSAARLIVFRADGGVRTGLGHLVRCIALAEAFMARGHRCSFVGAVPDFLKAAVPGGSPLPAPQGMEAWSDPEFRSCVAEAALLVTDHYDIGPQWQRQSPVPVLAISDPPLRPQHCKLLLLPTTFEPPARIEALIAPDHCLLRRAIVKHRRRPMNGNRLLVSCGGGDDRGLTLRIVSAIAQDPALAALPITIVLGQGVDRATIKAKVAQCHRATVLEDVTDMAGLIAAHDIAAGAPGGAALERACIGLAQVLIPIAANQRALGNGLAARGAAAVLPEDADRAAISTALRRLTDDAYHRTAMAAAGFALIDGKGAARVVETIERRVFNA